MNEMNGRELNFELNLFPVISILSVCICFLLVSAAWVHLGSLEVKQAFGATSDSGLNPPSLFLVLSAEGQIEVSVRDAPQMPAHLMAVRIPRTGDRDSQWQRLGEYLDRVRQSSPAITTVLISPATRSAYGSVIAVMDFLKSKNWKQMGIVPLN